MKKAFLLLFLLSSALLFSQKQETFSKQDSLRGSITKERIWWDLQRYDLKISVDVKHKKIKGSNTVYYKVVSPYNVMQIDLQAPMKITKASQDNKNISFEQLGSAYFLNLTKDQKVNTLDSIFIEFEGFPKETEAAPWEAGFTWKKDANGLDFVATTCQGEGASSWWPCKDHLYDEPNRGMDFHYTVPKNLVAVGNGRLIATTQDTLTNNTTFHWRVVNPINNYCVQLAIGDYVSYQTNHAGRAGILDCNYYVLKQNFSKAKTHFKEVDRTIEAFEYWFGPYPFYEDSYKIIEVPYLGMEHQSAIGYGNNYKNGYLGSDLSRTGWGLKFDFIIVHETGHEWFGNNITNKDIADMWIHESFTNYSESLFLEYFFSKNAAEEYLIGLRKNIRNDIPIIGSYNVNNEGSGDMYYKGANMLHTIRTIVGDDILWRKLLNSLNSTFYHQTITTKEIEDYISNYTGIDFTSVFNQYLRTVKIPVFEYKIKNKRLEYRWTNCNSNFDMPIITKINDLKATLYPTTDWKKTTSNSAIKRFNINRNIYINSKNVGEK